MTATTRQIPLLRVFVEGVVIVGSILLAFGIEAWWDERGQRGEEQEILAGLQVDFREIEQGLARNLDRSRLIVADIEFLLSLAGKPSSEIPVASADTAMRRLIQAPTFEPGQVTLDAVLGSGRLDLIQSRGLREDLSTWLNRLDEVRDNEIVVREFIRESLIAYLAREEVPLLRAYQVRTAGSSGVGVLNRPPSVVEDNAAAAIYARVLSAGEFRSLVAYRYNWAVLGIDEIEDALSVVRQILDRIEGEIEAQ